MNKKRKEEVQKKKGQKQAVKFSRLQNFIDKDLCACGPENKYLCKGICRQKHKNSSGVVICGAIYQIAKHDIIPRGRNKNRRNSSDSASNESSFDRKRKNRKE